MKAYMYDEHTKEYIGEVDAQIDPLETELKEEEVYLLPANSTFEEPMEEQEGFKIVFDGEKWVAEEIPQSEPEVIPEPTEEEKTQARVAVLKRQLSYSDYVVIKIAEGVATAEEYADVLVARRRWRAEINALESPAVEPVKDNNSTVVELSETSEDVVELYSMEI